MKYSVTHSLFISLLYQKFPLWFPVSRIAALKFMFLTLSDTLNKTFPDLILRGVYYSLIFNLNLKVLPCWSVCLWVCEYNDVFWSKQLERGCTCGLPRLLLDRGIVRVSRLSFYMFFCGLIVICLSVLGFICLLSMSTLSDFSSDNLFYYSINLIHNVSLLGSYSTSIFSFTCWIAAS